MLCDICVFAAYMANKDIYILGSGERLLYPSNRVRAANPVSVRVRDMVSASLSSAAVESPV